MRAIAVGVERDEARPPVGRQGPVIGVVRLRLQRHERSRYNRCETSAEHDVV